MSGLSVGLCRGDYTRFALNLPRVSCFNHLCQRFLCVWAEDNALSVKCCYTLGEAKFKMVQLMQCMRPAARTSSLEAVTSTFSCSKEVSWNTFNSSVQGFRGHTSLSQFRHGRSQAIDVHMAVSLPCSRISSIGSNRGDLECHGQISEENGGDGPAEQHIHSSQSSCGGLAEAAQTLDERARSDVNFLIRKILRLDMRARQDVAFLGSKFLKLDARAREDAEKLDQDARNKVARLRHMAMGFEEIARAELITAAEEHWSAGGLEADLRLADLRARRRALEDGFVALQVVKNVHNALVQIIQLREIEGPAEKMEISSGFAAQTMEKTRVDSGQMCSRRTVTERLAAMEDAYWEMAASLAKVNGSELKDPEDIEFVVAALLDMNEVDGGSGASLLAQCASSPDVATRRALADVLSGAPSVWNLGNAGMGALQRLAEDSNPAVAAAASDAINELKQQWQQQVGDALLFQLENEKDDPAN